MNETFYVLKHTVEFPNETECFEAEPRHEGPAPECPVCGRAIGMLTWLPPYFAIIDAWGPQFGDVAFCIGNELAVSEHFRRSYLNAGLGSLRDFSPIKARRVVRRKKKVNGPAPQYYLVKPPRSNAAVDDVRSGIDREGVVCPKCRGADLILRARQLILETGSWDGEDIFIARGLTGRFFVSQKFRDFCETYRITNAPLVPAEEYSFDFYAPHPAPPEDFGEIRRL